MHPAINILKQRFDTVPSASKSRAIKIIVIIIIILLLKNKVLGMFRKMFPKDISKIEVNQNNLSYGKSEYFSMCSTLEAAMNGSGTQEESIKGAMMQIRTQDDWNFLQKSFGVREKDGGTFYSDITGDLKMWLSDELDSDDLKEIRDIFQQQGINY